MKKNMKLNNAYYLSVEGETEKWYFEWLEDTINAKFSTEYIILYIFGIIATIWLYSFSV